MLVAGGAASDEEEARTRLERVIEDGSALKKLAKFVDAQGGDSAAVYDTALLPEASIVEDIDSVQDGYVCHIDCDEIGICSLLLGGGRETKESVIDLSVGLVLHKKVGDAVRTGEALATIYANDRNKLNAAKERFMQAYHFADGPVEEASLIKGIVRE